MRIGRVLGLVAGLAVAVGSVGARAEEAAPDAAIAAARVHIAARRFDAAADALGRAAAGAHVRDDLLAEQKVARGVRDLHKFSLVAGASATGPGSRVADAIARLAGHLDAKRLGVFVSAHHLATKLLIDGTDDGDHRHIDLVHGIFRIASSGGRVGRGGEILLRFSGAVSLHQDASTNDDWRAVEKLYSEALQLAGEAGFCDLEVVIRIEIAAMWLDRGDPKRTLGALTDAFDATTARHQACHCADPRAMERRLHTKWAVARARRFRDVPGASKLLERLDRPTTPGEGSGTRTSDAPPRERPGRGSIKTGGGGVAGVGQVAGAGPSDGEKWWDRLRSSSTIVTFKQKPAQTNVMAATSPKQRVSIPRPNWPVPTMLKPLMVSADRHQVALIGIDPSGRLGLPGQTEPELIDAAWYYLADGETLTVTRGGTVRIR